MASIADRAEKAASAPPGQKGRDAKSPAQIPGPGWKEIAFRTWKESALSDDAGARDPKPREPSASRRPAPRQAEHPYLAARATNRAAGLAGMRRVGMLSAALSTLGLSLMRKRGRAGAGAVLLASAAGLSLMRRDD